MTTEELTAFGLIVQTLASLLYIPIWRVLVKIRLELAENYVKKTDHKEDLKTLRDDLMENSRIRVVRGRER